MATIVTRIGKGSALTHFEMDANFNNLNGAKVETSAIGTAAASDVTTSSTDTTAGRLLKVGDFGVGGLISETVDVNNLTKNGFYVTSGAALNNPSTNGVYVVASTNFTNGGSQTAFDTVTGKMYFRTLLSGTWSAWKELVTTDNQQQIGVNQTWQDITASRITGVYYQNTTGKPLQLYLQVNSGAFSSLSYYDGANYETFAYSYEIYIIIPHGHYYEITTASGGINKVKELK